MIHRNTKTNPSELVELMPMNTFIFLSYKNIIEVYRLSFLRYQLMVNQLNVFKEKRITKP